VPRWSFAPELRSCKQIPEVIYFLFLSSHVYGPWEIYANQPRNLLSGTIVIGIQFPFLLVHEAGGHGWARASSAATILATCRRWTYTSALSPGALPLVFPVIFPSRTVIGIIVLYFVAWASIKVSFFTIVATVECFHGV
jgi:hypothetical protein